MGPKDENVVDNLQPEAGLIQFRVEEVLFKEIHEQIGLGQRQGVPMTVPFSFDYVNKIS